jgi:hypothetical protein
MDLGSFQLRHRFAEPAASLQDQGKTLALIAELGDNYDAYHGELKLLFRALGPRPEPSAFEGRFEDYQAANQAENELLEAERVLRLCTLLRQKSKKLESVFEVPTVDGTGQLYDFRDGVTVGPAPAPAPRATAKEQGIASPPRPTPRG